MRAYFLRRLLLIPPTLIGITLLVFVITRFVPGGPLERALAEAQMLSGDMGGRSNAVGQGLSISDAQIEQLKAYYGFDKPVLQSYLHWLGKVATGDMGQSYRYGQSVWSLIQERIPISLLFGLTSMVIIYTVSIPLGITKAIKHRTWIDNGTSVLVFVGYAIPGFALGAILLLFFSFQLSWFPSGGVTSWNFEELSFWGKLADVAHHATLPLICYLVGGFAVTTLLMKNNLMDQLAADYMRTATAKGLSFRYAVVRHALRNALIPIATTFGQNVSVLLSGSFLIETVFDINGMGLLGYTSILQRDYPVALGIIFLSALLLLIGNIISDIIVAVVDPRIRFN